MPRVNDFVRIASALAGMLTACRSGSQAPAASDALPAAPDAAALPRAVPCGRSVCPEILYERKGQLPRRGIEVDERDLFWGEVTNEGLWMRAAPRGGGGPIRTLGKWYDFSSGRSLVVDATHAYWLRPGLMVKVPKEGGTEQTFPLPTADGADDVGPIRDWGDAILVGTHGCHHLMRVPKDGSPVTSWRLRDVGAGGVTGVEVDDQSIYCANGAFILALDWRTGKQRELVSNQIKAGPMVRLGADLFFVNNRPTTDTGENLAVLSDGTALAMDLGPSFGQVGRLLPDQNRRTLHWVVGLSPDAGRVGMLNLDTRKTELVLDRLDVMGNSAADADYIYWLGDQSVLRLHK